MRRCRPDADGGKASFPAGLGEDADDAGRPVVVRGGEPRGAEHRGVGSHCTDGNGVVKYDNSLQSAHITEISYIDALCLFQKTPSMHIKTRQGRGGKKLNYVEGHYMNRCATIATNGRWSTDVLSHEIIEDMAVVLVKTTLYDEDGNERHQTQFGGAHIKRTKKGDEIIDIADDFKSATTDGTKKGLAMLGFSYDVYSGEANK